MNEERITESPSWRDPRGQVMKTPDDVTEMLWLKACGWGLKRIARHLGCSHHTVKGYVVAGGVKPFKSPERPKLLDGLEGWLRESFIRHRGNADVVRQDLLAERCGGEPANTATRGAAVSAGAEGRGAGDDTVRDATGPTAADRFRRAPGRDLRCQDQSIRVCGDARAFATAACACVPGREAHLIHATTARAIKKAAPSTTLRQCIGILILLCPNIGGWAEAF
jgi:hypothetical protein